MKIQTELFDMSKSPDSIIDFPISLYLFFNNSCGDIEMVSYQYYDDETLICNNGHRQKWSDLDNMIGWLFANKFEEIKKEDKKEYEQLTIADLIKEAKELGFKYIAQREDGKIAYFKYKVGPGCEDWLNWSGEPFDNYNKYVPFIKGGHENVKKWYDDWWTESLIEVK